MANSILRLSQEQEEAVDITKNIAVSAGAGSGKTRVLTNRFLRLLEAGINIEEIVAITFTEKAALEMMERIRGAISEKLESSDSQDKKKWQLALDKLSRANISTIHSFCAKIIKENAASIGIDFRFEIINEIDKERILKDAAEKSIVKLISEDKYQGVLNKLSNTFGEGYLDKEFKREIAEIAKRIFEKGKKLEDVYEELKDDEASNFILNILLKREEVYTQYKLENDVLDYNDLEILCNKVLENERIRNRYKERFTRFLVDEFQDTNEVQKGIIYSFVGDENKGLTPKRLFIVGDTKQSIYGFRGTDYTIYKKVAKDIGKEGQKSLSTCYRSKPEIIHGINEIFSKIIDEYENLKVPDKENNKVIEEKRLILLTYQNNKSDDVDSVKKVKEAIKDKNINIQEFKELLNELKNSYNKVQLKISAKQETISKSVKLLFNKGLNAKDICILVRRKKIIPEIEDELKKYNIPYCVIGGRGFYDKEEIKEILNIYELIISNLNENNSVEVEIKLIKALRSFLYNISDDILYKIKVEQIENKRVNYFKAIETFYDGMKEGIEKRRLENAYLTLLKLSNMKVKLSAMQVLNAIIETCSIKELVLMQEDGLQKYRNIEKLILEAEKFDIEELFSHEDFIKHIRLLDENNFEDAEASLDSEDTDAIKIMTIHQSKGLEFEGVIIPEMDADQLSLSRKDKNNIVYHDGKIITQYNIDNAEASNTKREVTEEYNLYFEKKLLKDVEESIRVLYVALTRSKQYAVMVGKELDEEISEIADDSEKEAKLNSFIKQVMYPFQVKGADNSFIELLDTSSLLNMDKLENNVEASKEIDLSNIKENLEFKTSDKIRSFVSASKYMKYKKCPRRFYIDSILNIKVSNYVNKSEKESDVYEETLKDSLEDAAVEILERDEQAKEIRHVNSSDLGIIVHKILEYKNNDINISDEILIEKGMSEILGKDNVNSLEDATRVRNRIKSFINNYKLIEENRKHFGENILKQNEVSFLSSPLSDRKTMLTGFIDRLEVFKSGEKNIAVITDYKTNHIENDEALNHLVEIYSSQLRLYGKVIKDSLYVDEKRIDEVRLQLYFLEKGICKEIPYDDRNTDELVNDMDRIFGRGLGKIGVEDFTKAEKDECEKCVYCDMCVE